MQLNKLGKSSLRGDSLCLRIVDDTVSIGHPNIDGSHCRHSRYAFELNEYVFPSVWVNTRSSRI